MAIIESKASLVLGTNVQLHLVDFQGTDIGVSVATDVATITSSTTDFTASSSAAGITKRAIVVGDVLTLSHLATSAAEGMQATVTAVSANSITADTSGVSDFTEAAGADINVTAFDKTYQFIEANGLDFQDGVKGLTFASWVVDLWDASDLDIYPSVFKSIEPRAKSLASINGWKPHDTDTINSVRGTALEIRPTATGDATQIYALWKSGDLHNVGDRQTTGDQFYFWPSSDAEITAPTSAVMKGSIDQLFLIYDADGADNRFSNGVTWFTRCAEPLKTIVMQEHEVNYAEIMPVSAANALDPKLTVSDASGAPYNNIVFTNDTLDYSGDVDGVNYNFDYLINAASETNEVVHNRVNWLLRQPTDINTGDAGVMRGDKQWPITTFTGDIFTVQGYLLNYVAAQRNNLRLVDTGSNTRQWPTIYSLTITSPSLAIGGTFSLIHANTYGASGAVYLQDESAVEQKDQAIAASTEIVIAYSSYSVDGHTPNTPIPLVLTWNRPGFVEPASIAFTMGAANTTQAISPTADPSYT
jgi:hypothetical protein